MSKLKDMLNDTLKTPGKNKYSRKSLTMFTSFFLAVVIGLYIVVSDLFGKREINPYAIQVFIGFLALAGGTGFATVLDKTNRQ